VSRRSRILAVNDDCCRENLCLMADTRLSGARVARELDALVRLYGKPASIVSDNGAEFTQPGDPEIQSDHGEDPRPVLRRRPLRPLALRTLIGLTRREER